MSDDRPQIEPDAATQPEAWPPGHYHSPIPDLGWVRAHEASIFADRDQVPGIDLCIADQLRLAEVLAQYAREQPFPDRPDGAHRFYYENDFFSYGDGVVLYSMLRQLRPQRLVEVGSGFSSALILETNERDLGSACECTFIDPSFERLGGLGLDAASTRARFVDQPVQEADASHFRALRANDILFIDSSHVAKTGSDVNYLLFEVLPMLDDGVYVHIHDIFWPFEYLPEWVYEGRAWNEAYIVRALLTGNPRLRITWFNHYLWVHHRASVGVSLPLWLRHPGGSLWLRVEATASNAAG